MLVYHRSLFRYVVGLNNANNFKESYLEIAKGIP